MPRITTDHVRALCAPPMAGGAVRSVLVWRDGRAFATTPDDAIARGGRAVLWRSELLDAGLPERADGSLGGRAVETCRRLAAEADAALARALAENED